MTMKVIVEVTEVRRKADSDFFYGRVCIPDTPGGRDSVPDEYLDDLEKYGAFEAPGIQMVGSFPDPSEGMYYQARVRLTRSTTFGYQLTIERGTSPIPQEVDLKASSREMLEALLRKCIRSANDEMRQEHGRTSGIGPSKIKAAFEKHGNDALAVLVDDPDSFESIGWPKFSANLIASRVSLVIAEIPVRRDLFELGQDGALDSGHVETLIKRFGLDAAKKLSANPFQFINGTLSIEPLDRFGFKRALKIAIRSGMHPLSGQFLQHALTNACIESYEKNGHSYGFYTGFLDYFGGVYRSIKKGRYYGSDESDEANAKAKWRSCVDLLLRIQDPVRCEMVSGVWVVQRDEYYQAESRIIEMIEDVGWCEARLDSSHARKFKLNEEQADALKLGMCYGFRSIIGGPGRGKTYTVSAILKTAEYEEPGRSWSLIAPTGKAATVMQSATGRSASTIHSWLQTARSDITDVIVDESSMIDTGLFDALLCKCREMDIRNILFVGDIDQLPPVGAGRPFFDLIDSDIIRKVKLKKVERTDKLGIIQACDAVNSGDLRTLKQISGGGFELHRHDRSSVIQDVLSVVEHWVSCGIDPNDIQVITARNGYGSAEKVGGSSKNLNEVLKPVLNPEIPGADLEGFVVSGEQVRIGDRVMQLKNSKLIDDRGRETRIANGEVGFVIEQSNDDHMIVDFGELSGANRRCAVHRRNNDLRLCYAATCHKFQGSQSPYVIVVAGPESRRIVDRSWIYTAISRSSSECHLFVSDGLLSHSVRNPPKILKRRSSLLRHKKR